MRFYITTFYQYDNYGTKLQNYALCNAIKSCGGEPVSVFVDNGWEKLKRVIRELLARCPILIEKQSIWRNNMKKRKTFETFDVKLNLKKYTYSQLYQIDFSDAVAIAGSDQIWSPEHLKRFPRERDLYFLQFAPKDKRFTYAPSFGSENIPDNLKTIYRNYLEQLQTVTIRERRGQELVWELTGKNATLLPDPVFLLSPEEWRAQSRRWGGSRKYVMVYFLGGAVPEVVQKIREYSEKMNCELVSVSGNFEQSEDIVPSPDEFVGLIDGAEMVFTDSFHASAFSIMMKTPFRVFKRKDVNQFSRLETLLQKFDCMGAIIEKADQIDDLEKAVKDGGSDIDRILAEEQKMGMEYLKSIEGKVNG